MMADSKDVLDSADVEVQAQAQQVDAEAGLAKGTVDPTTERGPSSHSVSESSADEGSNASVGVDDDEPDSYPMRDISVPMPGGGSMVCNPVTSFIGIGVLWGLAIWCMVDPDTALVELRDAKAWTTEYFTWLYVGTTPIMMFFLLFIYIVYGKQKLGKDTDSPEFDAPSYFAMLFSAGVAVGLFFYGVSEPLWHLSGNRFASQGFHSEDEISMWAINTTVFHWGLSAWTVYVLVAVVAGMAAYRNGLPLTMRSCFVPLLGEQTWGFWGDVIDGFSIVVVVSGVCTSLGLGAIQMVAGIERLTDLELETEDATNNAQIIAIWIVTGLATISVVSGLDVGIKLLSQIAIVLAAWLWFMVLALDKTEYLLNLVTAEVGYYFQWSIFQLNFATDPFAQLTTGNGRSTDGRSAYAAWMNDWLIFYWAWWTAWSSFVGLFVARISKGRTIREVIHFCLGGPLVWTFMWFCVFGGAGLRMTRRVAEVRALGEAQGNVDMYAVDKDSYDDNGTVYRCYAPPTETVTVGDIVYENDSPYITPVCAFEGPGRGDLIWWQTLEQYYSFGAFLSWLALFALAIFFVTSSDSGSLVVDHLASNGRSDHHWLQRVFWAFTEGAVATALLVAGGSDALAALQAASIVAGLPYTVFLCLLCTCLYRMCKGHANPDEYHRSNEFRIPVFGGILNVFDYVLDMCGGHPERTFAKDGLDAKIATDTGMALVAPFYMLWLVLGRLNRKAKHRVGNALLCAVLAVFFVLWITLFISVVAVPGAHLFGWCFYFVFATIIAGVRYTCRQKYNILGNFFEDFFSSLFLWFQVLVQMKEMTEGSDPEQDATQEEGDESLVRA